MVEINRHERDAIIKKYPGVMKLLRELRKGV